MPKDFLIVIFRIPHFELTVDGPKYTIFSEKSIFLKIMAKFYFGLNVTGQFSLNATAIGIGGFDFIRGNTIYINGDFENGTTSVKLNIRKSLEKLEELQNFRGFFRLWITVVSESGELQTIMDDSIEIYEQPLLISFHPLARTNFKAPIPFSE